MDVSVLTSRSEGLSITLLESMGHGLPVVATRVGGNPEVVVDGETGYLVPEDEPAAFVGRVAELLQNPELAREMGRRGQKRVREEFTLDRAARRYRRLYEELVTGREQRREVRDR